MHDDFHTQNDFPAQTLPIPALPERAEAAPFVIEHRQEGTAGSSFRPSARLILTGRVRTSGLWQALTPEDFANLILILSFVTPNGWCRPTLPELADAMGVPPAKAKSRLDRLLRETWQEQPLVELLARPDGLDAYLPSRRLVAHEDAAAPEPVQAAPVRTPGREAVVAYSRARYAKTREDVERQIGEMMGWGPPDFAGDDPAVADGKRQAFEATTGFGMPKEQALDLLARFDLAAVESQIAWLPSRGAKNPARFLAAAIEGSYDRPLNLRRQTGMGANNAEGLLKAEGSPERGADTALGRDASADDTLLNTNDILLSNAKHFNNADTL